MSHPTLKFKRPTRKSLGSHRSSLSAQKTEILINVYDLLPPGNVSSLLWFLGSSLLHTGVVIQSLDREYAFGGHDRQGMSGVYWTLPGQEPPGGSFRCELLQGFTFRSDLEIESVIKEVAQKFQGTSYNLLSCNCNHFTSYLCEKLTGKAPPPWLNRAASIGVAFPCVVPRDWILPPDHDTADGELLEEDDDDERSSMLRHEARTFHGNFMDSGPDVRSSDRDRRRGPNESSSTNDNEDRKLPASEWAPPPRTPPPRTVGT